MEDHSLTLLSAGESRWTIVRSMVEKATEKLGPEDRTALLWLDGWARNENLSRQDVAKLLEYDVSTLHRGFNGQLDNPVKFLRAVRQFRADKLKEQQPGARFPFTETPLVQSIWDYARYTRQRQKFGFLIGNSHSGKSEPLMHLAEKEEGMIYLRLPADGHLSFVLPKLIEQGGIPNGGTTTLSQRSAIRKFLTPDHFLIVDEIEQCCERVRSKGRKVSERVSTLEFFRELVDDKRVPVLYVGTKQALEMLHGDNYELYVRTLNRGIDPYEIPDKPESDDLDAFAAAIGLEPARGSALSLQTLIANKGEANRFGRDRTTGCLGRWLDKLLAGRDWALARGRTLTWKDVLDAHAEVVKGRARK